LWICRNEWSIIINIPQDFVANAHNSFFQRQMDRCLTLHGKLIFLKKKKKKKKKKKRNSLIKTFMKKAEIENILKLFG
jgi:5-bromo-4-chloroindolyl phosphate hydrolysis protein